MKFLFYVLLIMGLATQVHASKNIRCNISIDGKLSSEPQLQMAYPVGNLVHSFSALNKEGVSRSFSLGLMLNNSRLSMFINDADHSVMTPQGYDRNVYLAQMELDVSSEVVDATLRANDTLANSSPEISVQCTNKN